MSAVFEAHQTEAVRRALLAEVERLKDQAVSSEELGKVIKQFIAGTLSAQKTMQGIAQDLGASWMAARDLNFSHRYLAAVQAVTPVDLQRVARVYLTSENRTLYALLPKGTSPRVTHVASQCVDAPIQKLTLANGLRLLVKESHRLPFVEFRLVFKGGVLAETPANNGITVLLAKMLLQGTLTRSAEQIASQIESVGGHLDSYAGNNSFGINAEVLSADFDTGLDLLADVILNSSFPAEPLERERQIQLAQIRAQRDELLASAFRLMRRTYFGDRGYGLHSLGTESSTQAIAAWDLRQFHAALAVPNQSVLAIFGDVKTEAVRTAVEHRLAGWPQGPDALAGIKAPPRRAAGERAVETRDKKQAVLAVGFRGTSLFDEDRYPLELIQEACSDLGSRLFLRIRERLGLAYYVGAQNFPGLLPGYFAFYVGTEPEKVALVESELLEEARALGNGGLTEAELRRAKAKVIGQKKIARQDLGSLAASTALDELYGLGFQHTELEDAQYEAVTLDQVRAVAQAYLRPETAVVAVIRPDSDATASPA
jgi:zinc protease